MQQLSIVVPCFNEAGNIALIIGSFSKLVGERKNIEIILVDNGSTDNSKEIFEKELSQANKSFFKLVRIEKNEGYGHGILTGLNAATGDVLAWTHADLQTDPADVLKGFEILEKRNEKNIFIKGKRKKRKLLEAFFTFGMQLVAFFALGVYLDDINAQPKIFSRDFFEKFIKGRAPKDFSLDLFVLFTAKKLNYQILEIPVVFGKRHSGEAKGGGSWKTRNKLIKRTFSYIFELKRTLSSEA